MKIKTRPAEEVMQTARGPDYGEKIIAILKSIPKGHTVEDDDLRIALGIGDHCWWKYTRNYRADVPSTHRCYSHGHPIWAMPDVALNMIANGARRYRNQAES